MKDSSGRTLCWQIRLLQHRARQLLIAKKGQRSAPTVNKLLFSCIHCCSGCCAAIQLASTPSHLLPHLPLSLSTPHSVPTPSSSPFQAPPATKSSSSLPASPSVLWPPTAPAAGRPPHRSVVYSCCRCRCRFRYRRIGKKIHRQILQIVPGKAKHRTMLRRERARRTIGGTIE